MNANHPLTQRRIAMIEHALSEMPMDAYQLASAAFGALHTTREYLDYLHSEKKIHIVRWHIREGKQNRLFPLFVWGFGRDKKRPSKKEIHAKRQHQRWIELKTDKDRYELYLDRQRAKRLKPYADPMIALTAGVKTATDFLRTDSRCVAIEAGKGTEEKLRQISHSNEAAKVAQFLTVVTFPSAAWPTLSRLERRAA